ncbi:MAG: putative 4-hydroxybenzoate polyprenyltransferase [Bacteroidota bacterium]|nr:putative 4-hydroxybenzoate polyprenyltransferase [Bacteroidota bacterium]
MQEEKSASLSDYLSLIKFSHTIFALPFAVIGYFLAITFTEAKFSIQLFGLVILCMVFARSAAMAFNRFIDRKFDGQNERTAVREIPAGVINPSNALLFVIINCLLFISCTFLINRLCFYLSPVALIVILGYSLTKRFTALCHLILGIGLSLAPIGAYLAVTGKFDPLPLFFSFAVLFWVSGFDIIYALQDEDFDRSRDLRSIPVWLGKKGALMLSNFLHLISASFIVYAGWYAGFGTWYWIGAGFFIALLLYQHLLVKPTDLSKVNMAFATTNGVASVVFCAFVLIDLYL